ncbi:MAG: prepilin-type N-terminal cleavage/methylation domain-containing protein [Rhodospirillales bacterium]|jgi:general secretion pathway protein J|nr:prepilin-type N-terminal cleavage/methylation domain-containing protein [Rhodospirillales bacterium]
MSGGTAAKRGAQGFTLLETLVALTVVSLLSIVLFGGLRSGVAMQSSGTARSRQVQDVATLQTMLRAVLSDATPVLARDAAGRSRVVFRGGPQGIYFVAPMAARLGLGGLHRFRIDLESDGRDRRLVLHWALLHAERLTNAARQARTSILLDRVAAVRWSYFGAPPGGRGARWQDRWDGRASLPLLVRLDVTFADGRSMPALVIALRQVQGTAPA